ncbi:MAG: DoxX family protein [Candidatus Aminicenantales bacterium]
MDALIDAGRLILRIALGGILFAHGAQKLFGWFGGRGLSGHAGFIESLGLRPARLFAVISGLGEFFGGLGVLSGFLTPLAAAGIIGSMSVAIIKVHLPKGFWNHDGGMEYPLVLAVLAFVIGLVGPGPYSLDRAFGVRLPEPLTYIVALVLTAAVVIYAVTRPAPRKQP